MTEWMALRCRDVKADLRIESVRVPRLTAWDGIHRQ